jgi:hypothetical protein
MLDNMTVDKKGHVYLQEDVGGQAHIGKVYRYDIATDALVLIAQHNPELFTTAAPAFLTIDEESSGIIDASSHRTGLVPARRAGALQPRRHRARRGRPAPRDVRSRRAVNPPRSR